MIAGLARPLGRGDRREIARIEAERARLLASTETVSVRAAGQGAVAGEVDGDPTVAWLCARAAARRRKGTALFKLVRAHRPQQVVEMGTSVGISGAYLAAALRRNGAGRLATIEGRPAVAAVAEDAFARLGLDDVDVLVGSFEHRLPEVLAERSPDLVYVDGHHKQAPTLRYFDQVRGHARRGALVVFDDIAISEGMRAAWERIRQHPAVRYAMALQVIGVVQLR